MINIAKSFNLDNSSDLRKLSKEIERSVVNEAKTQATMNFYDVECPSCKHTVKVKSGRNVCPICFNEINVDLQFDF